MPDQIRCLGYVRKIKGKFHLNQGRYSLSQGIAGCQFQIPDQPHIKVTIFFSSAPVMCPLQKCNEYYHKLFVKMSIGVNIARFYN